MDNFFIQALVRAASCPDHQRQISTFRNDSSSAVKHHKARRKDLLPYEQKQSKFTKADGPLKRVRRFAEKELKALVDYYGIKFDSKHEEDDDLDDGPLIWNVGNYHVPWPFKEEIHKTYVEKIEGLLKHEESSHEEIFSCYKRLPSPGVVYLSTSTIRTFLAHLSVVERPDVASMQRFLSILDDMKRAHIHITRTEWTSAIYFAGRCFGKVSDEEVQSALYLWRDMETRAGLRGGVVTLNVLFDVAVKAGKYTLAELFIKEMEARKLKPHRHFRISLLYFYGVQQNGDKIRQTYQQLVAAGDIVDTVVMNAVIASLIRAGEPTAAEHVFERMKRLHASKPKPMPSPRNWRERRELGLQLTWEGRKLTQLGEADQHRELQDSSPIAPDARTFGLLIRHHASKTGNIDRIEALLREMLYKDVPLDGTILIVILHGFSNFGGVRYSSWTLDKLERIWAGFVNNVRGGVERTWFSPLAVIAGLKAFRKCADAERTLRAWEEVQRLWEPKPEELQDVLVALKKLVPSREFFNENV